MQSSEGFANNFQQIITDQVNDYLAATHQKARGLPSMYFKTFVVLLWTSVSYYLLIFTSGGLPYKVGMSVSLAFAIPSILFNITHDANHFTISEHKMINKLFCFSADLIGVSSTIWRIFHNRHHRNPNVLGLDFDLEQGYFLRFSPHQKRRWFHQYQVFYVWILFPFILIRRNYIKDFMCLKKIFQEKRKTLTRMDLVGIVVGKIGFVFLSFILPSFYYSISVVLCFYFLIYGIAGVIISVIFIVAHINDKATFLLASKPNESAGNFIAQIESSVDFSRSNPILGWYLGGLNFQIEHHLFPQICHIHYPALSKIVEKTCHQFNIEYKANNSFYEAISSYCLWLNHLGKTVNLNSS